MKALRLPEQYGCFLFRLCSALLRLVVRVLPRVNAQVLLLKNVTIATYGRERSLVQGRSQFR